MGLRRNAEGNGNPGNGTTDAQGNGQMEPAASAGSVSIKGLDLMSTEFSAVTLGGSVPLIS